MKIILAEESEEVEIILEGMPSNSISIGLKHTYVDAPEPIEILVSIQELKIALNAIAIEAMESEVEYEQGK